MTDSQAGAVGGQIPRWGPHVAAPGFLGLWQRQGAGEISYVAEEHGLVVALTPIVGRETRLAGGRGHRHLAPAGSITLIPAGADHWGCWGGEKETAYFALGPGRLAALAASQFDDDRVELRASDRPARDPTLLHLSWLLREELRRGGQMTELYADTLGTLIMLHLLRRHSSLAETARETASRGRLPGQTLTAVLEHMAGRCAQPITIAELAAIARLTPGSFIRAFRAATGTTPHRHLLELRVARAQALMAGGHLPLAEIALAAGFSSQSHLTTVFGRIAGTTPAAWRRRG